MKKIVSSLLFAAGFFMAASAQNVADFENLPFDTTAQWWFGALEGGKSSFESGSYQFHNDKTVTPEYSYWNGFGYSKVSNSEYDPNIGLDNQYRCVAGGGVDGSPIFAVGFYSAYSGSSLITPAEGAPCTVNGTYLTNIATTYNDIINGSGYVTPFKKGDFYKVIFTGKLKGDTVGVVETYLADYRDENPDNHFALKTWEWFDLSALGTVDTILVSSASSQVGQYGDNVSAYVALDNFGSKAPVDTLPWVVKLQVGEDTSFSFDFLFELPGKGDYFGSIIDSTDAQIASMAIQDTLVTIKAVAPGQTSFTVKGMRNGRYSFACIPVEVEGPSSNSLLSQEAEARIYPVPARSEINIYAEGSYQVEIFDLSGKRIISGNRLSQTSTFDLSGFHPGIYMARIITSKGVAVKRFIVAR